MKIVISPAKTLYYQSEIPTQRHTMPIFLGNSEKLNSVLKKKTPKKLMNLMDISMNLAELNWKRNQHWHIPFTLENSRQALYAFKGDVYLGLDAYTIPLEKIEKVQQKLRILSGLYGLLKPLDLIQPYRLEMGIPLRVNHSKNLYQYWKTKIVNELNEELVENELFINLASNEYFKAVNIKKLKVPVITPVFKDYHKGELKIISFFAKKARGLMVRFVLDNNIETLEGLKGFNYEGYAFDSNLSSKSRLVFTR